MTIFTSWRPEDSELFGNQPICLAHNLHQHPLFTIDALADLIDRYPEEKYNLVRMGPQGSPRKQWEEGKIRGLSGKQVIEMIRHGRLWINLLRVQSVDDRYRQLLDSIYEEIASHVPEMAAAFRRICGILISSPGAQVYYHFDTSGQNLWQIAGSKRVYLYPPVYPFLKQRELEHVTVFHGETSIQYEPWYDEYARVYDLQAGSMLHWQLNAPHRIENGDELSISFTTEFFTKDIRRSVRNISANGWLRHIGLNPGDRPSSGLPYLAKVGMFTLAKRAGLLERKRQEQHKVHFELSPESVG